ncbi:DoxX family membrane protein [Streptomyces radicis]|uniref:DoxX family membrane protein n=1 Tax=Streptomyces radicis TaxID=1750517 RepID=A0A3A9VYM6_9ACTN|nr:DoxX family membrane protein [Streptomyces radicis]RKN05830.1 DoxX family membrane protein [Streptomyces radicis]RKN17616.1 DoxX family membrane protein [Streptomyces radicis]
MTAQESSLTAGARPGTPKVGPVAGAGATPADKALAALRIATGIVFLWAFLDKAFGFGYATSSENAWINGGQPAAGYLGSVAGGPMESTYNAWAGDVWVDWMYMAGMLGLGLALVAGIGLRVTAVAGTLMMLFLWAGEFPPAKHLSDGTPTMSANPAVDHHVVYAVAMIVVAACSAGRVWGLGRAWERLPLVRRFPWLR